MLSIQTFARSPIGNRKVVELSYHVNKSTNRNMFSILVKQAAYKNTSYPILTELYLLFYKVHMVTCLEWRDMQEVQYIGFYQRHFQQISIERKRNVTTINKTSPILCFSERSINAQGLDCEGALNYEYKWHICTVPDFLPDRMFLEKMFFAFMWT